MLEAATRGVGRLGDRIEEYVSLHVARCQTFHVCGRIKQTDASKLQDEYAKLVEGLRETEYSENDITGSPGERARILAVGMLLTARTSSSA